MDPDRYLARLGVDPTEELDPTFETVERLQSAHVRTVPFETLSITGDPYGDRSGEGVTLELEALYEKLVERERGGFCFELNGLFGWLLAELGFDVDRIAACVLDDDGDPRPPANHHALLVDFDRPHVVDVGLGLPKLREPLPVGGRVGPDGAGIEWRTVESDRPDAEYVVQTRSKGAWDDRYIFTTDPRPLSYFAATCDHLATAPESTFTGDPTVNVGTERGYKRLTTETFTEVSGGEKRERAVAPEAYRDTLESEFGIRFR